MLFEFSRYRWRRTTTVHREKHLIRGTYMAENNFNDWNRQIIEEFHANGGKVGGPFEGAPLLLLTTTGAKSGQHRISPLAYLPDGERLFIFASKGGAPTNPDWYHNLLAHPVVTVEVGTEQFPATAVVIEGEERDQIYATQAQHMPGFAEYQEKTSRKIPVVELVRNKS
jgi:deazaflavin-dependent oxidoreductase (nitroreductase family)